MSRVGHVPAVTLGFDHAACAAALGGVWSHAPWGGAPFCLCAKQLPPPLHFACVLSSCRIVTGDGSKGREEDSMADCTNAAIRNIFRTPGPFHPPPQCWPPLPSRPVCRVRPVCFWALRSSYALHVRGYAPQCGLVPCTADAVVDCVIPRLMKSGAVGCCFASWTMQASRSANIGPTTGRFTASTWYGRLGGWAEVQERPTLSNCLCCCKRRRR
jgi:hypothetical protein